MTCPQALSLLDDYIDGEVTPAQSAEVQQHLETCTSCREEYEAGVLLKDVLKQSQDESRIPHPGEDYWTEVSSLIEARTIDVPLHTEEQEHYPLGRPAKEQRQTLVRSLMLFAASLALMVGALYVGSQRQQMASIFQAADSQLLLTASLSDVVASDHHAVVTKEEEVILVRGMLAIGAPGPVGRYGGLTGLIDPY